MPFLRHGVSEAWVEKHSGNGASSRFPKPTRRGENPEREENELRDYVGKTVIPKMNAAAKKARAFDLKATRGSPSDRAKAQAHADKRKVLRDTLDEFGASADERLGQIEWERATSAARRKK